MIQILVPRSYISNLGDTYIYNTLLVECYKDYQQLSRCQLEAYAKAIEESSLDVTALVAYGNHALQFNIFYGGGSIFQTPTLYFSLLNYHRCSLCINQIK